MAKHFYLALIVIDDDDGEYLTDNVETATWLATHSWVKDTIVFELEAPISLVWQMDGFYHEMVADLRANGYYE